MTKNTVQIFVVFFFLIFISSSLFRLKIGEPVTLNMTLHYVYLYIETLREVENIKSFH